MFSYGLWFAVLFALLSCLRVVSGPSPTPDELAAEFMLADLALAGRWLSTGQVLEAQGLAHLALEAFLVAARLDPRLPTPHESMGKIFEIYFGDAEGAAPHYRRAKQRASTDAQMHYLMGNFAKSRGQHARAARLHAAAIALQPSFFEAHNNLATALISLANEANQSHHHTVRDFFRSALDALAKAIALQPTHELPLQTAMTLAHKTCDFRYWHTHAEIVRATFADHLRKGVQMFMPWQSSVYGLTPELMLLNARSMSESVIQSVGNFRFPSTFLRDEGLLPASGEFADDGDDGGSSPMSQHARAPVAAVRIGYLSCSGFQGNTTTSNFVRGLFGWHNGSMFETHCFLRGAHPFPGHIDGSPAQAHVLRECNYVHDVIDLDIGQVAAKIANLKIGLLVDLSGWTLFPCTEITAMQPAAVQLQWHGYPGSMGARFIQYLGSDATTTPPEHSSYYHEKLMLLHGSYMLNYHRKSHAEALQLQLPAHPQASRFTRASLGRYLREQGSALFYFDADGMNQTLDGFDDSDVILCSWNTLYKGDPSTIGSWMQTLKRVAKARLWFMQFDPTAPPNLALLAHESGIDTSRVAWSTFFSKETEFVVKGLADIFLDTPNFNAHTTGVDALWSNTPLLTMPGKEFTGRVAASLNAATSPMQLNVMVTRNEQDYRETLEALASSPHHIAVLKRDLDTVRRHVPEHLTAEPLHHPDHTVRKACQGKSAFIEKGILFDGVRWMQSWESGLRRALEVEIMGLAPMHLTPGPVRFPPISLV